MRPRLVEVALVLPGDATKVPIIQNNHMVEDLAPCAADKAFSDGVHVGCAYSGLDEQKANAVTRAQARLACATSEHVDLVPEDGVFHDKLATRAAAQVGGDLERFNPAGKGSEGRLQAAGDCSDLCDDEGGIHGVVRPRSGWPVQIASPGLQVEPIYLISFRMRK
jgi:hypothetical protein